MTLFGKEVYDKVNELAKELRPEAVKFIQKLIQTPAISGEEFDLTELLIAEMKKLGYDEVFRDAQGNIVGMVHGEPGGPTIMYNSHMDHVSPGNPDNWEGYDPYGGLIDICKVDNKDRTAVEEVECIHGRGASDVKAGHGFQIYAGAVLIRLRELGHRFRGTFMYTGVVQEEPAEMVGMSYLIDNTFKERGLDYDAMVSSEATSLNLYLGHRGRTEYLITTYGRTSHGSRPHYGINAIYKAIPVIQAIQNELIPSLPADPDGDLENASLSLNIISCSPGALSIVPDQCFLSLDRRTLPGETKETALAELQAILDKVAASDPQFKGDVVVKSAVERSYTGMEFDVAKDMAPWKTPKDHPFTKACAEALESVGQEVSYGYWSFGTDGSKTAGIDKKPTIGFSGMQEQYAHTPIDKCRTDFIELAIAGNASIFLKSSEMDKEEFKKLEF
ncbi:MAG: peptidase dimerization protein [Firmicutes bacterium HGW-Firmicutes-11]|jgi:putative selenium metabolism hydrolase|nr:MAG: peptidase dimerization protein [Firmicutes bacterium HGW-Firmicutes-11]